MIRSIPGAFAGAMLGLAVLASACGGAVSSAPEEGTVDLDFEAVAARTADHGSIRHRSTIEIQMSTFGIDSHITLIMEGATDLSSGAAEMTVVSTEFDTPVPIPDEADMTGTVIRVIDGVSYTSPSPVPIDAQWLATDAPPNAGMMDLPGTGTLDAQGVLDLLATLADPAQLGSETIEGLDTTHWSATGRYGDFLEASGQSLGELVAQFQQVMGAGYAQAGWEPPSEGQLRVAIGTVPVTADVWVDDAGELRRASFSFAMGQIFSALMPPEAQAAAQTMDMTMTMSMTVLDFGDALQIEAPTDVVHLTQDQLLRAQITQSGSMVAPVPEELTPEQQDQVDSTQLVRLWVSAVENHFGDHGAYPADAEALTASTSLPSSDLLEFVLDGDGINYCLVTIGAGSIQTVRYATHGWGRSGFATEYDVPAGECEELLASF